MRTRSNESSQTATPPSVYDQQISHMTLKYIIKQQHVTFSKSNAPHLSTALSFLTRFARPLLHKHQTKHKFEKYEILIRKIQRPWRKLQLSWLALVTIHGRRRRSMQIEISWHAVSLTGSLAWQENRTSKKRRCDFQKLLLVHWLSIERNWDEIPKELTIFGPRQRGAINVKFVRYNEYVDTQ